MKVRIERNLFGGQIEVREEDWQGAATVADVRRMSSVLYGTRRTAGAEYLPDDCPPAVPQGWILIGVFGVSGFRIMVAA